MLTQEDLKNPELVEKLVGEAMDRKVPKLELDQEQMAMLMSVLLSQKENHYPEGVTEESISQQSLGYSIFKQRLEGMGIDSIFETRLLCSLQITSPGDAVLLAIYVAYKLKRFSEKKLNMDKFCKDVFPMGFPDLRAEQMGEIWDSQKVKRGVETFSSDNAVDYMSALKSLCSDNIKAE